MPIRSFPWPLFTLSLLLFAVAPAPMQAIPAFARRYDLKCSACHTVVPVLNEQGYMFKRLGFHLPPSLASNQPAPTIKDLVAKEPAWTVTNNVALAVADVGFQAERTTQEGQSPSSTSAFQVNAWNTYAAGWIPDTNFFYFAELDIVAGGATSPDLAQAFFGYSGGTARNSWFLTAGRQNLEAAEGTRAAAVYSLMPSSPLLFETASPTNFLLDQNPVGVSAGYTWASTSYKNVLAITAKVTNGDNADGSEILGPSAKNSKDIWLDADWWYAPESGITVLDYYGSKDQIQNSGLSNQFTYRPAIRRFGVFANRMFNYKVDVLGGYLQSKDDWEYVAATPGGFFRANDFFGEVDYYLKQGFALSGRYDLLRQRITGSVGNQCMDDWTAAVNKTLTRSGNIVARGSYSFLSGRDPSFALKSTDRLFQADIEFNF